VRNAPRAPELLWPFTIGRDCADWETGCSQARHYDDSQQKSAAWRIGPLSGRRESRLAAPHTPKNMFGADDAAGYGGREGCGHCSRHGWTVLRAAD